MNEHDRIRLQHMLDSAQAAVNFTANEERTSLDNDLKLVFAVVRAIEIIGEAAGRISTSCQTEYPELPWPGMIGMRNVLIHNYFDVDLEQLWETVQRDLSPLIAQLKSILPEDDSI